MTVVDRSVLPDDRFIRSRQDAYRAELAVAFTCVHAGAVEVAVPEYRIRPSCGERGGYRDSGDLRVRWKHGHDKKRYEVKHRDINFTSLDDYPFPTVFVDEVANLNDKNPRPDGYFVCNAQLDAALFVDVRRLERLDTVTRYDNRYLQDIDFYVADLGSIRCIALNWR